MTGRFRVYATDDLLGVEVGGSLKNIIAIAAGSADALGFGANAKAALLTRGLVEMVRLGVAMGGLGSDAAIEAADAVVMDDRLDRLPTALRIASFTRLIVWENIILALGIKVVFLALGAAGAATMWEAVIADVGVALAAVLNSTRAAKFDSPVSRR